MRRVEPRLSIDARLDYDPGSRNNPITPSMDEQLFDEENVDLVKQSKPSAAVDQDSGRNVLRTRNGLTLDGPLPSYLTNSYLRKKRRAPRQCLLKGSRTAKHLGNFRRCRRPPGERDRPDFNLGPRWPGHRLLSSSTTFELHVVKECLRIDL